MLSLDTKHIPSDTVTFGGLSNSPPAALIQYLGTILSTATKFSDQTVSVDRTAG